MNFYKNIIQEKLVKKFDGIEINLTIPPSQQGGDLALPCFTICKELKKSFNEVFKIIEEELRNLDFIYTYEQVNGYINIFFKKDIIIKHILNEIYCQKDSYGSSYTGKNKSALIEHTSINPNASPHIGRARNALIGDCLVRLMKFEGYNVHTHYFVNDVGKQIAMLVLGARREIDIEFNDLLDIYVNINNELKENDKLEKEVFNLLYKFEHGDEKTINEFKRVVDICIKGQSQIFKELGIEYDYYDYESEYIFEGTTNSIIKQLDSSKSLFEAEDGRLVINLEKYGLPVLVLTRNDKTSLYPLRDIAYTIDKAKFNYEKNIIVLGEDQKLYFNQINSVMDILGVKAPEVVHYSFVLLSSGKMSTRSGSVVLLEEIMNEAINKVKIEMKKRSNFIDEEHVKRIAYGVIKYTILKISNEKNVTFDWDSALNFEGNTSLYIQYNYARICSILRKLDKNLNLECIDYSILNTEYEYEMIKCLGDFKEIIQKTINSSSPHIICSYLYSLSKLFSKFYNECSILNIDDVNVKESRIALIIAVKQVIENGLNILGIDIVERV